MKERPSQKQLTSPSGLQPSKDKSLEAVQLAKGEPKESWDLRYAMFCLRLLGVAGVSAFVIVGMVELGKKVYESFGG